MALLLVLNSGSSSLKFKLFRLPGLEVAARGAVEGIGEPQGGAWMEVQGRRFALKEAVEDHHRAFSLLSRLAEESGLPWRREGVAAVGHRVVHGGELFREPTVIDDGVVEAIRGLIPLAPLHNPANLVGIEAARARFPQAVQVAVFDTAFHQTLPPEAYIYALPLSLYREKGVRRYGFHGTSHGYVSREAARFLGRPLEELRLISLHLGNGASAAAVLQGRCVETSMGLTPTEGLVMGTRCGDLDPAIPFFLMRDTGMGPEEVEGLLNHRSGLLGLCGENDMRRIEERARRGDREAATALELFCHRVRKYIGAYAAVMGGLDCLIFTGGIGEHSPEVRARCCRGLGFLGIDLDQGANDAKSRRTRAIHRPQAEVAVLVVPTDEELEIARLTAALMAEVQEKS